MSLQASEEERGWISANGIGIQNDILDLRYIKDWDL